MRENTVLPITDTRLVKSTSLAQFMIEATHLDTGETEYLSKTRVINNFSTIPRLMREYAIDITPTIFNKVSTMFNAKPEQDRRLTFEYKDCLCSVHKVPLEEDLILTVECPTLDMWCILAKQGIPILNLALAERTVPHKMGKRISDPNLKEEYRLDYVNSEKYKQDLERQKLKESIENATDTKIKRKRKRKRRRKTSTATASKATTTKATKTIAETTTSEDGGQSSTTDATATSATPSVTVKPQRKKKSTVSNPARVTRKFLPPPITEATDNTEPPSLSSSNTKAKTKGKTNTKTKTKTETNGNGTSDSGRLYEIKSMVLNPTSPITKIRRSDDDDDYDNDNDY